MTKLSRRFMFYMNKHGPISAVLRTRCWEWTGCVNRGYGWCFRNYTGLRKAHRVSWILAKGLVPIDKCVLHNCDNRLCVRPDHLFLGTVVDNNKDMVAKNRQAKGEGLPQAKLTEQRVVSIRKLQGLLSHRTIGKIFGVCRQTCTAVLSRETWKHV